MAERTRKRFDDRDTEQVPISAREAVRLTRDYIGEITEREMAQITSATPAAEGGWVVEVEIVEDRRVPSSADILALYEIELDADGELLAYSRTHRYTRGNTGTGRTNGGGP